MTSIKAIAITCGMPDGKHQCGRLLCTVASFEGNLVQVTNPDETGAFLVGGGLPMMMVEGTVHLLVPCDRHDLLAVDRSAVLEALGKGQKAIFANHRVSGAGTKRRREGPDLPPGMMILDT